MKTTISVNISGLLFYIEEDAYRKLKNYLFEISNRFASYTEKKEIMEDIEARISELFKEKLNDRKQAINTEDVNDIIKIIGQPEDIGGSDNSKEKRYRQTYSDNVYYRKRLYRDIDDKIFGGVCGGMGYYFDIEPYIMRIIFLVAFLGFGFGIILYIILWIIVPGAYSYDQKKEMKGERPA